MVGIGWNTSFLLGRPIFRCCVGFREGVSYVQPTLANGSINLSARPFVPLILDRSVRPSPFKSCSPLWILAYQDQI